MVRDPREWGRDAFPRNQPYLPDRFGTDCTDDGRFADGHDIHRRQPPMQIDEALRQYCGITGRSFFVAAIMDDGYSRTFSAGVGPAGLGRMSPDIVGQFFDEGKYLAVMSRLDAGANPHLDENYGMSGDYSRNRMADRRRPSNFGEWDNTARPGRKRARPRHPVNDDDEDQPMIVNSNRKHMKIGNDDDLWRYYEQRFKNLQQTACKMMAKAWVKAVEPKKQSTHPYTGSDEKAPDWWPKPWGPTKEDKVRHKEPDHLYKRERVHLLNHILRMITEPNKSQHADIQKLNLNVKKLEEITTEALSGFFADKENPANAKKRPYLSEIFMVAKFEERWRNGEIDGETQIWVMGEDKLPESYTSENDDGSLKKEEEDQAASPAKSSTTHGLLTTPTTDQSPAPTLHSTSFISDLPMRGNHYSASVMPDMHPQQHAFVEGSGVPVSGQPPVHGLDIGVTSPHDSSGRRPSLFSSPTDYAAQTGSALYAQQWQPGSTAPNTPAMYTFTPQQTNPASSSFVNSGVPMGQAQPYMASSFDGLSRAGYDPSQAAIFRAGAVPQPQVHTSHGYDYITHDARGLPDVKTDPAARTSMH